jgi:hypothetical protein
MRINLNIKKIYSIISAILGFIGSIWLSYSIIFTSSKAIEQLSGTYFDTNPYLLSALEETKIDSIIGLLFIVMSFTINLLILVFDDRVHMNKKSRCKPMIAIILPSLGLILIAVILRFFIVEN